MIASVMRSGNNAVCVVTAATVVGVGGDVGGVRDGGERIHVYDALGRSEPVEIRRLVQDFIPGRRSSSIVNHAHVKNGFVCV